MMTSILYLLKEASEYVFPSVPFNEKAGALAPIANVGCSSAGFAKEIFMNEIKTLGELRNSGYT
jgi:hypothetical protein